MDRIQGKGDKRHREGAGDARQEREENRKETGDGNRSHGTGDKKQRIRERGQGKA